MEKNIRDLEPKKVFEYFEKLTKIPRGSGNEKKVSDFLVEFAGKKGLLAYQDEFNNVTILKPATDGMEDKPNIILQAHMDMVCVADADSSVDLKKDGIEVLIDGDYITANNTTLGADDGIGVAMILAVLDSDDIAHPMIEAVFTTDEEEGLTGAQGYDCSRIKGTRFINLDTEEESTIVIGCAGGCRCNFSSKCKNGKVEGNIYELSITHLSGGHSGTDIVKGGANANVLLARLIAGAMKCSEISLGSFTGGVKDNAICASASATVVVKKKQGKAFEKYVKTFAEEAAKEYAVTDPDMKIKCKDKGKGKLEVISGKDLIRLMGVMNTLPGGVKKMSQSAEGMVEASSNMGIVNIKPKSANISLSLRSNRDLLLDDMISSAEMIAKAFSVEMSVAGHYPAWEGDDCEFSKAAAGLYKKMFDRDIRTVSIHAGLECAVFSKKIKDMEAISIGPDIEDAHTVSERLSIPSTLREWQYLVELLKL